MPDRLGPASLTAEGRARRERVRLQAAEMFAQDADPVQIARSLRVSTNDQQRVHRDPVR